MRSKLQVPRTGNKEVDKAFAVVVNYINSLHDTTASPITAYKGAGKEGSLKVSVTADGPVLSFHDGKGWNESIVGLFSKGRVKVDFDKFLTESPITVGTSGDSQFEDGEYQITIPHRVMTINGNTFKVLIDNT